MKDDAPNEYDEMQRLLTMIEGFQELNLPSGSIVSAALTTRDIERLRRAVQYSIEDMWW